MPRLDLADPLAQYGMHPQGSRFRSFLDISAISAYRQEETPGHHAFPKEFALADQREPAVWIRFQQATDGLF